MLLVQEQTTTPGGKKGKEEWIKRIMEDGEQGGWRARRMKIREDEEQGG